MSDAPRPPSAPQTFGTVTGPPTTVNLQQMQDLVNALNNSVRASANIYSALQGVIAAFGGLTTTGLNLTPSYTNDAAAATGGVPVGHLYRNGSGVQIRVA